MLLAIETATRQLGVAVVDGERLLSRYELLMDYPPSRCAASMRSAIQKPHSMCDSGKEPFRRSARCN